MIFMVFNKQWIWFSLLSKNSTYKAQFGFYCSPIGYKRTALRKDSLLNGCRGM